MLLPMLACANASHLPDDPQALVDSPAAAESSMRIAECKRLIREMDGAIRAYELDQDRYPSLCRNAEVVQALSSSTAGEPPYFDFSPWRLNDEKEVTDPWGRPLRFYNNAVNWPGNRGEAHYHNKETFDLSSAGPDGRWDTPDDIANWR